MLPVADDARGLYARYRSVFPDDDIPLEVFEKQIDVYGFVGLHQWWVTPERMDAHPEGSE